MYKQHSIVNIGNFNADFKLLTHNRYSVLNGHFVRQIHPSSFTLGLFLKKMSFEMVQNFMHINVHFCTELRNLFQSGHNY